MNEKELYQRTFSKIHVSNDPVEEILNMNQKKTVRKFRPALAAALCVCVIVGGALTANAATGGAFFKSITLAFGAGEGDQHFTESFGGNGESIPAPAAVDFPENAAEQYVFAEGIGAYVTADGAVFLLQNGQETDITAQLSENGRYTFSFDGPNGTADAGIEVKTVDGKPMYYLFSTDEGGKSEGWLGASAGSYDALLTE